MKHPWFNMNFKSFGTVFSKISKKVLFLLKIRTDFWFEIIFSWVFWMISISIVLLSKMTLPVTKIGF